MKEEQSPYPISQEEDATDLVRVFKDYLRYWPWFVLSIMLFMMGGHLKLRYTPKVYQSFAKIKVLEEGNGLNLDMEGLLFNKSQVNLENEIEILTSYRMLEIVEKELQLRNVFYTQGDVRTAQLDALPFSYQQILGGDSLNFVGSFKIKVTPSAFEVYSVAKDSTILFANHDTYLYQHSLPFQVKIESPEQLALCIGKEFTILIQSKKSAILRLKGGLEVKPIGGNSEILQLSIKGENVLRSERILNAIIKVFNEDGVQDRKSISKRTVEFIDERFISLSEELDSIELGKKEFKQNNNLVYIESDSEISLRKRAQADDEVFRVENQLALSELLEEAIKKPNTKGRLLPANFGLESEVINGLIGKYNTAILDNEKLISSGGINNPIVMGLQGQLDDLRANIVNSLGAFKKHLQLSQSQLLSRDKEFRSEVYSLPQKEKLLRAINRQQQIKETLFLLLLQKREEASISLAVIEPSIKVVDYALSGSSPVSPNTRIIYFGSLVMGLFLPFGVLFIVFLFDNKIHGKNDIQKLGSNIAIVGEIPKINDGSESVFSNPNDRSILAESFRILSSNVDYILPLKEEGKGRIVYITSTIKGEGKTFISLNLSLALSSLDKKVLLIGADLRNPQLHSYLDIDKQLPGLSLYLNDPNYHWKDVLLKGFTGHPNHDTLISGLIPPNPPHLLTNSRFEVLLEEARSLYDYIIVDTAPTIGVTDTLLISKFADATIYVTRANYTEKSLLEHSNALSKNNKLKNMAYVVNHVGDNNVYGYSYRYNYGYGYGYGEDIAKRSWIDRIFTR
jgi:capsular exopolysaccharide synthesis family protein